MHGVQFVAALRAHVSGSEIVCVCVCALGWRFSMN